MRKILTLLTVLLLGVFATHAQSRTITGRVTDNTGKPVDGASVTVKGTTTGTTSKTDGTFTISARNSDALLISAINFSPFEVTVGEQTNLEVTLNQKAGVLDEVVVTALGQTKSKARIGYSATTISTETLNRSAPTGALDGVAGKIAGADISSVSGTPGGSTKVVLRGYGVIGGGNNQPLYVIDGVPLDDNRFSSGSATSGYFDFGNGLNSLNPNDIESITVLKGTAASSLYGGLAKNGAIMITTKKGRAGKLKVEFISSDNFSEAGKLPDYQKKYGQGWDGTFYESENGSWGPALDGKDHLWGAIVDNSQLIKPFSYHSIRDFYDKGLESNNTISLSGGNDISKFYFSYGNVFSDGILPSKADYLERHTMALRTNSTFKNFTFNTSFNYVNRKVNSPSTQSESGVGSSLFEQIIQMPTDIPIRDFKDYNNKFFNVDNYFTPYAENPYYDLYENGATQRSDRFFGNFDMSYKFTNWFSAQFRFGGDFTNARTAIHNAINAPTPGSYNDGGNVEGSKRSPNIGSYEEISGYSGTLNGDFILKFNTNFGQKISLDAIAGVNYNQIEGRSVSARIEDLTIPNFYNLSNSKNLPTASNSYSRRRLVGAYGQVTLGYENQLFLTGNIRNDWSSTLPINNNSIFYPGANLSWVASNTFNLISPTLSLLKFRAAYGKTGSDAPVYSVFSTLVPGDVALGFGDITFPFNGVSGFEVGNTIGGANLKPVITKEIELGLEMKFLNNRIGLDAAVYRKRTDGQILNVPISPSTGYTSLIQNLGLVENKGVEITLDVNPVKTKDFSWNFTYTFTKNVNEVKSLNSELKKIIVNSAYDAELDAIPGKPLGTFLASAPVYTPDGKIVVDATTGFPIVATDKAEYGSSQRDFTMGLQNTFTYKDFSLGFSFDYRKGGKFYSGTADLLLFTGNSYLTTYNDRRPYIFPNSVNAVTDDAGKTTYVENTTVITESNFDDRYYTNLGKAIAYNDRILDKSFLKLRDITLSYRLPKSVGTKIGASDLSLTLYGRNILLWTPKSNIYIDPEASNFGNDLTSEFGEFRTGPTLRSYGLSLRASF